MDEPHFEPHATLEPSEPARRDPIPTAPLVGISLVAILVALVAGFALNDDDGSTVLSEVPDFPPTTLAPSTTTSTTIAPSDSATVTEPTGFDRTTAVWPDPASDLRFTDPAEATRSFAVELVGFTDPIVGQSLAPTGTTTSVNVRSREDGPVTAVTLHQDPVDSTWWVTSAATGEILVVAPLAGSVVSSPIALQGSARAFEGTVDVLVHADGAAAPAGTGFVTGGAVELGPFDGQVEFTPGAATTGSLVFRTLSAEDGRVEQATVVRLRFTP